MPRGLLHMQPNTELETQSVRENCNCKENLLVGESLLFNLRSVRLIIDQGCHYPRQSSTTIEAMSCFAVVKGGWHTYDTARMLNVSLIQERSLSNPTSSTRIYKHLPCGFSNVVPQSSTVNNRLQQNIIVWF